MYIPLTSVDDNGAKKMLWACDHVLPRSTASGQSIRSLGHELLINRVWAFIQLAQIEGLSHGPGRIETRDVRL